MCWNRWLWVWAILGVLNIQWVGLMPGTPWVQGPLYHSLGLPLISGPLLFHHYCCDRSDREIFHDCLPTPPLLKMSLVWVYIWEWRRLWSPICKCSISSKAAAYFHNGICFPNLIFVAVSSQAPFGRRCCFSLLIFNVKIAQLSLSLLHTGAFQGREFFLQYCYNFKNIFITLKIFLQL